MPPLIAPLRFVPDICVCFMRDVLGMPHLLGEVTLETTLYDFGPMEDGESLEAFEGRVIEGTIRHFGVCIRPVLGRPLPEIFHYIRSHLPRLPLPRPVRLRDMLPFEIDGGGDWSA